MAENIDIKINVVSAKSVKQATKDIDDLGKAGKKAGKDITIGIESSTSALSTFQGVLGAEVALGAFNSIVGAVNSVGSAVINQAKSIEVFTTQFTVLTGSIEQADKLLRDLQEFSASTPFQLEGIADATKVLLSFGFAAEEQTELLRQIGDVAAISGKPLKDLAVIFGQVEAAGKLTGERFNQLVESGVNVGPEIAKILGISEKAVRSAISAGQVTAEVFQQAFRSLSEEGGIAFEGMVRQSETLEGVLSTTADNFSLLAADIGKQFLPLIKTIALEIITLTQNFREFFNENIPAFKVLGVALTAVTAGIAAFIAQTALATVGVTSLSTAMGVLGVVAKATWVAVTGPIGIAVLALTALGAAFVAVQENVFGLGEVFKRVSAFFLDGFATILEFQAKIDEGFRFLVGSLLQQWLRFQSVFIDGIIRIAELSDKAFGTDIATSIEVFRSKVEDAVETFKTAESPLTSLAEGTREYADSLNEAADAQEAVRVAEEQRLEKIEALKNEQADLNRQIEENGGLQTEATRQRLAQIDAEIAKLEELKTAEADKNTKTKENIDELLKIQEDFQVREEALRKAGDDAASKRLQVQLQQEKVSRLEALRDRFVSENNFIEARRTEIEAQRQRELETELQAEVEKTDALVQLEQERLAKINELKLQQDQLDLEKKEIEAEIKLTDNEREIEQLNAQLLELEAKDLESKSRLEKANGNHLEALRKANEAARAKDQAAELRANKANLQFSDLTNKQKVQQAANTANLLVGLSKAAGAESSAAGKAVAVSQAIISGILAVQNTLASAPFPLNVANAAIIGATTALNVKKILSTQIPGAQFGGVIQPAGGVSRLSQSDRLLIRANPEEEVLTRDDPRNILNLRNQGPRNGGSGISDEQIERLVDAISNITIVTEIDGREVGRSQQNEAFRGSVGN